MTDPSGLSVGRNRLSQRHAESAAFCERQERGCVNPVTEGYALGNWHLCNGKSDQAMAIFERVVAGDQWPAFGSIAAEVELAGMR